MSENKKKYDKERIRLNRLNESLEERELRLEKNREYKKTKAGKKAIYKNDLKKNT